MTAAAETVLYLDGVSVSFDGFKALNELSFYVLESEMRAIIGPNGAGKTTMMDVVTGRTRPDDGQVLFRGNTDLTRLDEADISNLGIGRKFQKATVFDNQTVFHNLELAPQGAARRVRHAVRQADGGGHATGSMPCSRPSRSRRGATRWRARCRTARSNGWRSACC